MAEEVENEPATKEATIVDNSRRREVRVGVNGEVKGFRTNTPIALTDYQIEVLRNAGYKLVVADESAGGEEGSAPSVDQGPDDNRTEPHQGKGPLESDVVEGGAGERDADGAPIIKGGDEPDPLHGEGESGAQSADNQPDEAGEASDEPQDARDPLDHDGDGKKGGSEAYVPPALTGKTTAELEQIAADEKVDLSGEDIKTNADRIKAIQAAREANA